MTRRRQRRLAATALVALGFGLVAGACSSDDGGTKVSDKSSTTNASRGTAIDIVDFAFEPSPLRAKVGDTITVTNRDDTEHTVTADQGPVDTGHIASKGTATFELTEPGTFAYHCDIHNYMTGTIKVS